MKKLAKLKKDLEMIRSDDVKVPLELIFKFLSQFQATTERIIEAKRKAQAARDEAKAAKQRAVELYEKIKSDVRVNQKPITILEAEYCNGRGKVESDYFRFQTLAISLTNKMLKKKLS